MKKVVLALVATMVFAGSAQADEGKQIGYQLTSAEVTNFRDKMVSSEALQKVLSELKACRTPGATESGACKDSQQAYAKLFPGSTLNASGDAHLVFGQTEYEYKNFNLVKSSQRASNGLQYVMTFNGTSTLSETKNASGNFITVKVNHEHPEDSHIVAANLPSPIMSALTRILEKRGITASDKVVVGALDDFYREKVSSEEFTMKAMITDFLLDPAGQDSFLAFCETK
jgi:hypothetical protein